MDDRLKRTIGRAGSWDDLRQLEANIRQKEKFSEAVAAAIQNRASELGLALIAEKTSIDVSSLSAAE